MGIKPIISKGLGALTPEVWAEIVKAVSFAKSNATLAISDQTGDSSFPSLTLAQITGSSVLEGSGLASRRWKYSWKRVVVLGTQSTCTAEEPANGRVVGSITDGTTDAAPSKWAINLFELGNTATLRGGYTHSSDTNYIVGSNGFQTAKVPDDTIVPMIPMRLVQGRLQWCFWYPNPVDGACTTALVNTYDGGNFYGVT